MSVVRTTTASRCRRCGGALQGDQRWCLSCGLAIGTAVIRTTVWRRPLAAATALGAVALVALALAFALLTRNDNPVPQTAPVPAPAAPADTAAD